MFGLSGVELHEASSQQANKRHPEKKAMGRPKLIFHILRLPPFGGLPCLPPSSFGYALHNASIRKALNVSGIAELRMMLSVEQYKLNVCLYEIWFCVYITCNTCNLILLEVEKNGLDPVLLGWSTTSIMENSHLILFVSIYEWAGVVNEALKRDRIHSPNPTLT